MKYKSGLGRWTVPGLPVGVVIWMLLSANGAAAQSSGTIDAGTTIAVRTNEQINGRNSDGRVFSGVVAQNVANRRGSVAIPRGSRVELLLREVSRNEFVLDLASITVNGQRYGIQGEEGPEITQRAAGLGANERTGTFVGGGAAIGAILGAIAGGAKGAAIGGGIGAAGGAGTQMMTRGGNVYVPAESLVTFRLVRPLRTVADWGYERNGQRYRPDYGANGAYGAAYQAGLRAGQADSEGYMARNARNNRWSDGQDPRDYEEGYNRGYDGGIRTSPQATAAVRIGSDHNITWQGPPNARVYVQVDNAPFKLFAAGPSGTQSALWMMAGHLYVFVLHDANEREIARDQSDLRRAPSPGYRSR